MDLFYFFFHLALNILRKNGQCAFITTNYYITALGAKKLRSDFKNRSTLYKIINFNELKIFESALGQHNMITILQKGCKPITQCNIINTNKTGMLNNDFYSIINKEDTDTVYSNIIQTDLYEGDENYIRMNISSENKLLASILNKVKCNNKILRDICTVNNGVHTEADYLSQKKYELRNNKSKKVGDGIYVLDTNNLNDSLVLKSFQNNELDRIKPFYKNSDIKKYYTNTKTTKSLIYINKKTHDIDNFPSIKKHLDDFKYIIDNSSDNAPYLHRPKEETNFKYPKIVCPQRSTSNIFGYNETNWYAASDVFFITHNDNTYNLKYILALLNSKLYYIWLYNKGKRKGNTLELTATPLQEIPIKYISPEIQNKFITKIDQILFLTNSDDYSSNTQKQQAVKGYENQIDIMVYKLYDLTYQEVLTIDPEFPMSEEEYERFEI